MDKKYIIGIIAIALVLILALAFVFGLQSYKRHTWDGHSCDTYTQDCVCFGKLTIFESYPPQYRCSGYEYCKDINETVCR